MYVAPCSWRERWKYDMIYALDVTKPVFVVSGKVWLKSVLSATVTSLKIEISPLASLDMILITKVRISLRRCPGWSAPLLFANPKDRFSRVEAYMIFKNPKEWVTFLYHYIFRTQTQSSFGFFSTKPGSSGICSWLVGWLVGFVALRPKSTAMVIAARSVHLTTLFPGQAWTSG